MSLQFIIGRSGSGKTKYLYEHLIDLSMGGERGVLLMVPEQATLSAQKDLVSMHPRKSVSDIEILSFHRLSLRLLEEQGINSLKVMDDTAINLILRKLIIDHEKDLKVLGKSRPKMGYVDEIKSFITELSQYGNAPCDLTNVIGDKSLDGFFSLKEKMRESGYFEQKNIC